MEGELNIEEMNSLNLLSLIESNSFVIYNFLLRMFCFNLCFLYVTCGSVLTKGLSLYRFI